MRDSSLDRYANANHWLAAVPVWDWVGGRFSVLSPVGLLPLALLGADLDGLLAGAKAMDSLGRRQDCLENPPLLLAGYFLHQTQVQGKKNMVILPYKDRLELWGRFLQQLVMESLGKTVTAEGHSRQHGITVFGNKGSTDQHSYIQQLLEGNDDFFAVLFSVLEAGAFTRQPVEDGGIAMGDYLLAFCHGTCQAFAQKKRQALLITLDRLDAFALGCLIALYERAVGFYAAALGINPYHQPGVEAGKKSAQGFIALQKELDAILLPYIQEQQGLDAAATALSSQRLLAELHTRYGREERRALYYMLRARQANREPAPDFTGCPLTVLLEK
jgi:glucose-6-phosphate isomerase